MAKSKHHLRGDAHAPWPTFLGDPQRRSATAAKLSATIKPLVQARIASLRRDDVNADRRESERHLGALSRGFWIGQQLHLSLTLADLPAHMHHGPKPPVALDRSGTRMRFRTNFGRGGSTHPWKGAMTVPGA
jgi:hypothetical protein